MKNCSKCSREIEDSVLFCPSCGTKQYLPQEGKIRKDVLLVRIANSTMYRGGVIPVSCVFKLFDDKLVLEDANERSLFCLSMTDIESAQPYNQFITGTKGIRIGMVNNKTLTISFLPIYADFIPYLINLILDWKWQG